MKKISVILVMLFLICSMSTLGFAATSEKKAAVTTEHVTGKIGSINAAMNEIVVKDNKTGIEKTIMVDPKVISSLKGGEEVRVMLKTGSNVAESVKELVKKTASTKK